MKRTLLAGLAALALNTPARADVEGAGAFLAMIGYVEDNCPDMQANPSLIRRARQAQGYEWEDIEANLATPNRVPLVEVIRAAARSLSQIEKATPAYNCHAFWVAFGPGGTVIDGAWVRK